MLYLGASARPATRNDFYAAAVQAGTKSWKAFFFGSFDSSNFITVDKPPAVAVADGARPGGSSASTRGRCWCRRRSRASPRSWLLYATVRRWFGHAAGLLAGALLALTPVAVLMFRFNNPDALMTLLIVAAGLLRRSARSRRRRRAGCCSPALIMGFSFLAKGLQPFTVLPALALAYLVAAPTSLRRRLLQLLAAGAARRRRRRLVGAGGRADAGGRPAVHRRLGEQQRARPGLRLQRPGPAHRRRPAAGRRRGGGGFSGATGVGRLFNALNGGQIAWLLPAALVAVARARRCRAGARRAPTGSRRAAPLGRLAARHRRVLSFASGIIHTYYTVELAPAIAALVAIGAVVLWRTRAASWRPGSGWRPARS